MPVPVAVQKQERARLPLLLVPLRGLLLLMMTARTLPAQKATPLTRGLQLHLMATLASSSAASERALLPSHYPTAPQLLQQAHLHPAPALSAWTPSQRRRER